MKTAGIIGGMDFLGCDITLKFLSENYQVKVIVPLWLKNYQPVITTGLKAGKNLQIFCIDMDNHIQLTNIIKDCDCLIHCGRPYQLDVKTKDGPVYVPIVSDTGNILKALREAPIDGKIIFLTSVGIFNKPYFAPVIFKLQSKSKKHILEQAFYHSEKIIENTLADFTGNRIDIMIVSPVVVINNILTSTHESTVAGLKFLFSNTIDKDRVFRKLVKRNSVETMLTVNEVPDKVFDTIQSYQRVLESISEK